LPVGYSTTFGHFPAALLSYALLAVHSTHPISYKSIFYRLLASKNGNFCPFSSKQCDDNC
jgi:hypothetical protein